MSESRPEFSHHLATDTVEHPFAETIRILGKGKKGARALTQEEAYQAMRMIMAGDVLPEQLGAFLMLLRIKEETPEELAGMVLAAREACQLTPMPLQVDLDWATYAGKRRHLPWFILSALLLAENGIKILMHGVPGPASSRLYTQAALRHLGLSPAESAEDAANQITRHNFSYLSLEKFCPRLNDIIELRPILGLRSPVHTLVRLLNPCHAPFSIQGIFHPSYRAVHQHAAALLQQPHMAVLKGEGGETERNPDMDCLVQSIHDGALSEEVWPALFAQRHVKDESLEPERLALLWQGKIEDEFAQASVVGTTAVALKLLGKAESQGESLALAESFWQNREKSRVCACTP
jgi:anthranilate phosphoribosyltransferase